jgi:Hypoxia induced protein conserved region
MQTILAVLPWLIGLAMIAVVVSLFAGLFTMARGGEMNRRHGNTLMRWRVASQATAIILVAIYFLLRQM